MMSFLLMLCWIPMAEGSKSSLHDLYEHVCVVSSCQIGVKLKFSSLSAKGSELQVIKSNKIG